MTMVTQILGEITWYIIVATYNTHNFRRICFPYRGLQSSSLKNTLSRNHSVSRFRSNIHNINHQPPRQIEAATVLCRWLRRVTMFLPFVILTYNIGMSVSCQISTRAFSASQFLSIIDRSADIYLSKIDLSKYISRIAKLS